MHFLVLRAILLAEQKQAQTIQLNSGKLLQPQCLLNHFSLWASLKDDTLLCAVCKGTDRGLAVICLFGKLLASAAPTVGQLLQHFALQTRCDPNLSMCPIKTMKIQLQSPDQKIIQRLSTVSGSHEMFHACLDVPLSLNTDALFERGTLCSYIFQSILPWKT